MCVCLRVRVCVRSCPAWSRSIKETQERQAKREAQSRAAAAAAAATAAGGAGGDDGGEAGSSEDEGEADGDGAEAYEKAPRRNKVCVLLACVAAARTCFVAMQVWGWAVGVVVLRPATWLLSSAGCPPSGSKSSGV